MKLCYCAFSTVNA